MEQVDKMKDSFFGFMDNGTIVYAGQFESHEDADEVLDDHEHKCVRTISWTELGILIKSLQDALALAKKDVHGREQDSEEALLYHRKAVAYAAGCKAAHEQQQCVPAMDQAYMDLVAARPRPVGEGVRQSWRWNG